MDHGSLLRDRALADASARIILSARRKEALEEASTGQETSHASVRPEVFVALRECLQPRAVRPPPRQIEALFSLVP